MKKYTFLLSFIFVILFSIGVYCYKIFKLQTTYPNELLSQLKDQNEDIPITIFPNRMQISYVTKNEEEAFAIFADDHELLSFLHKVYVPKAMQNIPDLIANRFQIIYDHKEVAGFAKDRPHLKKEECDEFNIDQEFCAYRDYTYHIEPLSVVGPYLSYYTSIDYAWNRSLVSIRDFYTIDYKNNKTVSLLDLFEEDSLVSNLKKSILDYFEENETLNDDIKQMVQNTKTFTELNTVLEKIKMELPNCSFAWSQHNLNKFALGKPDENLESIPIKIFISNFISNMCRDKVVVLELKAKPLPEFQKTYQHAMSDKVFYFIGSDFYENDGFWI